MIKENFSNFIDNLQKDITSSLEIIDGKEKFKSEHWNREKGGGGLTMVIENGDVFEKGGVNVSKVHGQLPDSMSKMLKVTNSEFFACGISIVIHPKNPMVPTFHANLRYFELYEKDELKDSWFGGGLDLTPYYLFENDVFIFTRHAKTHAIITIQIFMKIIKRNVIITFGTVIEMKLGELAECFLIIAEKINL